MNLVSVCGEMTAIDGYGVDPEDAAKQSISPCIKPVLKPESCIPEDEQEKQGDNRGWYKRTLHPVHKGHTMQVITSKARQGRLKGPGSPAL
ncbi:hypothetical protein TNCV_1242241 [Trichonephila clavipes]|nr:hypothetical protein TNCV_1242241 [Trichonephila clavipes]